MPEGIILKGIGGFYYVKTPEGIFECRARGIFRFKNNEITPLPGDKVQINIISREQAKGNIEEIMPRSTLLVRPAVANVDKVFATIAVKSPQPDLLLLDKILVTARVKGIKPYLCINKIDMDENACFFAEINKAYSGVVCGIIALTKTKGELYGELVEHMSCNINVFAGQSGVGKSTILNHLIKEDIMEIGIVSAKTDRGKHTTRHAQLLELDNGGYIVDTPGFSNFEVDNMEPLDLQRYYPDFEIYNDHCRFNGCAHINEPDCAVKDGVTKGEIDAGRYDRYQALYEFFLDAKINKYRRK